MPADRTAGRPAPEIRVDQVTEWLVATVKNVRPPFAFERFPGGHSNITYGLTDRAGRRLVFRRPPLGALLRTANDVGREFRVIEALGPTGVPVPKAYAYCDDLAVNGSPFFVMDWVEGTPLTDLTAVKRSSVIERRTAALSLIDVLAGLHSVDPDAVGLGDYGRKEGFIGRQLRRWYAQWEKTKTVDVPDVDHVHDALASMIPPQGPAAIVHGDYRFGNLLMGVDCRVAAVLDWEISTLGDPLADLGYTMVWWHRPGTETKGGAIQASMAEGMPERAELVDRYRDRTGRDVSRLEYYMAFSHWRLACIAQGVVARYESGALGQVAPSVVESQRRQMRRSAELARRSLERASG